MNALIAASNSAAKLPQSLSVGHVVDFAGTLTAHDQGLVMAATGYDVADRRADTLVPMLAVAIAIERAAGRLHGPVDAAFVLRNLPDDEWRAARQRALGFLSPATACHCAA